jgi:hypothetical protein
MKVCQGKLYALYFDPTTTFKSLIFHQFNALMNARHESVIMKWIIDQTTPIEHFFFSVKPNTFGPNIKM